MKKMILLGIVAALMLAGCGRGASDVDDTVNDVIEEDYVIEEDVEVGGDWTTWGSFIGLEWFSPDATLNIYVGLTENPAGLVIVEDKSEYSEICRVEFHSNVIYDSNMVWDTLRVEDIDGDGYGDIAVRDQEPEGVFENIYLWDDTQKIFVYSEDCSEYYEAFEEEYSQDTELAELPYDVVAQAIVDYYTEQNKPEGNYIIFDNEYAEDEYVVEFTLRYQPSDAEEEQMIADGTGPLANVYVTNVIYYKGDRTVEEGETGLIIPIDFSVYEYDEEPTEGAPYVEDGRFIDDEPVEDLDIAGAYSGITYGLCELSMYTDVVDGDVEVGIICIYDDNDELIIESPINKIMDNYYELQNNYADITIYTDNGNVCFELYENGAHSDYFVMTSHFGS